MKKYEEANTRIVVDVNLGEDDLVQMKNENYDKKKV